jgi:phosphatidate cytidylyltransferase
MALRMDLGTGRSVVLGVVLAAAGQVGDLCESLLKRSAGAKDSGALVPEFGGALDLLDSLLLSAPLAYLLLN